MDKAVSIKRRLAAMKAFHQAGVRTTCFISPIFPGITDVKAIMERAKEQCSLIWLENLNLRGSYKAVIMEYIKENYPALLPLYQDIYNRNDRSYWERLDAELKEYASEIALDYVTNDDSMSRPFRRLRLLSSTIFITAKSKNRRSKSIGIVIYRRINIIWLHYLLQ